MRFGKVETVPGQKRLHYAANTSAFCKHLHRQHTNAKLANNGLNVPHDKPLEALHHNGCECNGTVVVEAGHQRLPETIMVALVEDVSEEICSCSTSVEE